MMMFSIFLFGLLALPFAGLTAQNYSHLTALAVLYCCLTTVQGIYTVIEGSYIPIFMRSTGWFRTSVVGRSDDSPEGKIWQKGVSVSVLALVSSNVGALMALIIGVILVYGRGSYVKVGYFNYLLAITIAGCITSKPVSNPSPLSPTKGSPANPLILQSCSPSSATGSSRTCRGKN